MSKLDRFHNAQQGLSSLPSFKQAFGEIHQGTKVSHWIWYILPQLKELGFSGTAKHYGIEDAQEACDYLRNKALFDNYLSIIKEIQIQIKHRSITYVMGSSIDAKKLMSSITLFREVAAYLNSLQQEPFHDYKGMVETCDYILERAAKDNLFLCQHTASIISPQLKSMPTSQAAVQVITVEKDSPIASTKKASTAKISLTEPSIPIPTVTSAPTLFNASIKTTDNSLPPPAKKTSQTEILKEIKEYLDIRNNEWNFHYNFLGIISVIYFLHDAVWGTDYYNNKSKAAKLSAATKIETWINSSDSAPLELSPAEHKATQEGRLGEILKKHGGLASLQNNTTAEIVQIKLK